MNIQSYYEPQESGEYMYIQYDIDSKSSQPIAAPEYFDTFAGVQKRHAANKTISELSLLPAIQSTK